MNRLKQRARRAFGDVLALWCALTLLTSLPYATAALRTPPRHVFTGVLSAYDDTFTYLAWIKQGAEGHLLMLDKFTSEPHSRQFFLPLWAGLGLFARATGLPVAAVFHIGRVMAALFLLLAARAVVGTVMKSRRRVKYTLWLFAFSAGLGWLLFAANARGYSIWNAPGEALHGSADLDVPEAITFRSAFAQVHLTLGAALMYAAMALVIMALKQQRKNFAILAGLAVSLLAVVHPFDVTVVVTVAASAFALWPWLSQGSGADRVRPGLAPSLHLAFWFSVACVPAVAYLLFLYLSNDVGRQWSHVISALSPGPVEYLLGFGIMVLLAAVGFRLLWRRHKGPGCVLLAWAVIQAILLYAPVSFQRRLVEGMHLPLSIATSVAIFWMATRLHRAGFSKRLRNALLAGAIAITAVTNMGFLVAETSTLAPADPRRYVSDDLVAAFDWLSANAEPNSILFCAYKTGNIAPALSGMRVYAGHYDLTLRCKEKQDQVEALYAGRISGQEARNLLASNGAAYCIYGPFEREIASEFSPPDCLVPVHNAGDVQLFKVLTEPLR